MLRNTAYIVISSDAVGDGDGVFELRHDLDVESQINKSYLIANFGQTIQEAARYIPSEDPAPSDSIAERRQGYSVDAGGGEWGGTLTFTTGLEDVRWGDESGGTGSGNETKTDASGEGVHPLTRLQVLQYWVANTLSDSRGQVRIHVGEWTDGSFQDYRNGERVAVDAGLYGTPIPAAISTVEPRRSPDEPSNMTGTIQYRRTQIVDELVEDVAEWIINLSGSAENIVTGDSSEAFPDA